MKIDLPGFHLLPAEIYHQDPCGHGASLSHSVLRILLDQSPLHAREAHPRLRPERAHRKAVKVSRGLSAMDKGTCLHHLLLRGGTPPVILPYDDWRTSKAKDEYDAARAAGRIPIKHDDYLALADCAEAVREQMQDHPGCAEFFWPGRSEVMMLWQIGPVWCRGLIDRLPDQAGAPMFNLKGTGKSAEPKKFERTISRDYATGSVFYKNGAAALGRPAGEDRFVTFEWEPPYALSVSAAGPTLLERAEADVMRGVKLWARCLITGEWPGYPADIHSVELPWWETADALLAQAETPAPLSVAA